MSDPSSQAERVDHLVLGAGPAGLGAAWSLARRGQAPVVLERSDAVGGLARTVAWGEHRFDIGPHRFFTRFDEVQALWQEVLGDDLLTVDRLTRVLYRGTFFDYPLRATNALVGLGPLEAARCLGSYARARAAPAREARSFEDWVAGRFGDRLFDIFFRTYTEKVWGIPTSEIAADWAAQRIKGLSLGTAVAEALGRPLGLGRPKVVSMVDRFHYPRLGSGQLYERMAEQVQSAGGRVLRGHEAARVRWAGDRVTEVVARRSGGSVAFAPAQVYSSMPLTLLIRALEPRVPEPVWKAAHSLEFRNLVTVFVTLDGPSPVPDQWVYVHDPEVRMARVQVPSSFSAAMVPHADAGSLGVEYFCGWEDELWTADHGQLVALAGRELERAGLLGGRRVVGGTVVRSPRAYPVYRVGYEEPLGRVVEFLRGFRNLHAMGRYGMFKYNNADHSLLTALLTVENVLDGAGHDVWGVNTDSEYHEIRPARAG